MLWVGLGKGIGRALRRVCNERAQAPIGAGLGWRIWEQAPQRLGSTRAAVNPLQHLAEALPCPCHAPACVLQADTPDEQLEELLSKQLEEEIKLCKEELSLIPKMAGGL